ncbi:hypothetical protein BGX26_011906 [Mortierella sp. AD094]|nr:hypothetical protein BGX26_011906 [Mortierella sp. AD094]
MVHFTGSDIVLFVVAVFLPPLVSVFLLFKEGCGWDFLISLGLTLFGYVPGVLHAWWVIYTNREDPRTGRRIITRTPSGSRRRTYVQVASQPPPDGAIPPPGVIKTYKVVEQRVTQSQVPQGQGVPQGLPHGQVGQIVQQQGGTQQYTTTSTKTLPQGQQYTTTTTTTSGPVRTTYTTHTTQYVGTAPDKKDQNPPVY